MVDDRKLYARVFQRLRRRFGPGRGKIPKTILREEVSKERGKEISRHRREEARARRMGLSEPEAPRKRPRRVEPLPLYGPEPKKPRFVKVEPAPTVDLDIWRERSEAPETAKEREDLAIEKIKREGVTDFDKILEILEA